MQCGNCNCREMQINIFPRCISRLTEIFSDFIRGLCSTNMPLHEDGLIPEVVNYHKRNSACDSSVPAIFGTWEINHRELKLLEELDSGNFGVVHRGTLRETIDVAVKIMREDRTSKEDFIKEAEVMIKLQHANIVQLYGVCSKSRPFFIVTEYMPHGSLLEYLHRHEHFLYNNQQLLIDMCIQVCNGMTYMEQHNYIHRDLAAKNCLVGAKNIVKVADFGLSRYVLDDQYSPSRGSNIPIRLSPPEVVIHNRYSSKSDVWAYGILMWEVFTYGEIPENHVVNCNDVKCFQKGLRLNKPQDCSAVVYDVMEQCWSPLPEQRPSFCSLKDKLIDVSQDLLD